MPTLQRLDPTTILATAAALSQELAANAVERDRTAGIPTYEVSRLRETGLLSLVIPQEYGGAGADLVTVYQVIKALAKADGSIGQLYGNHVGLVTLAHAIGTPAQKERDYRGTAQHQWFWGNAINTRDDRLKLSPDGDGFRLNGEKGFGTGIPAADRWVFSAVQAGVELPLFLAIPSDRPGVTILDDWDNVGQRRTASNSLSFDNVWVEADEIYGPPVDPDGAFATLPGPVAQVAKVYTYLGIAEGALEAARQYTQEKTRPWVASGVSGITTEPYILRHYGELWTELQAASALADKVAEQVQVAWEKGDTLTHEERGEVAVQVSAAKAFSTRVGLDIANRIFEVTGSRATATHYGFDRYWRDLRTFTLHDPADYKLRDVGNWFLNGVYPTPTQYS
ncbi:acyl-CoA dehydrogenase family protein [Nodosilinea sp. PGN35]|uniref:acyl-CoA dehydrogenase family protein n=1 Tax=Nodosilinea sp. PGN35 TaxID=3020489 RepID=UPI0023B25C66|nr:acyl-CoA dehydrogenase family protein [Nodosilinea sp. TSF1-S3]MDF0366295.1 acyl-CoA dehydrogenase family protein [Nodosilinea sp. TSF1-S3]